MSAPSGPGVGLLEGGPQPLIGDVGVDLRGGERRVPEDLLHAAQIGTSFEQMSRHGVPQPVRPEVRSPGHSFQSPVDDAADDPLVDAGTALPQEHRRAGRRGRQPSAFGQPGLQRPPRRAAERDHPLLGPLAEHADEPVFAVDVADVQPAELGHPDATAPGLAGLLRALLAEDPAQRPSAAAARDAIPERTEPAALWSRTADGTVLDLTDQVERSEGRPEVPLEGPAALAGQAPGLHERLSALAAPSRPAPSQAAPSQPAPSPAPPTAVEPADEDSTLPSAASPTPVTEAFVDVPTARATAVAGPSATPTTAPVGPAAPARGARRHPVLGGVLLALSVLSLSGAGALWWAALG